MLNLIIYNLIIDFVHVLITHDRGHCSINNRYHSYLLTYMNFASSSKNLNLDFKITINNRHKK